MPTTLEMRSEIHELHNTVAAYKPSSAVVVQLEDQPVEGGNNPVYGDVSWRTLISSDRTPTSDLILGVAEFSAHGVLHLHRHEPAEFYMCLSGSGVVTIDGIKHPVKAGSAVFVPGNAEHGVLAGVEGLTFAYGFAQQSFTDVDYVFSTNGPSLVDTV